MSRESIRAERVKKLELLKRAGINPYPSSSGRTVDIKAFLYGFEKADREKELTVAGRIMAIRTHGGSLFVDLYDGTGRLQCYLKKDAIGDEYFELFEEAIDIGDFIDVTGTPFLTKRKEQSVLASGWTLLTKTLLPLPEKWAGIKDPEERLRKRYLDILFNKDVHDMVGKRAVFWQATRNFLLDKGFLEVETPALEITVGGADAKPFVTHHNAFDMDVYLRISAGELWQKQLVVSGFPKVFEIGRIFRNEGMSHEHLQDYTQMEFYLAYADYEVGMKLVEELYRHVAKKTFSTLTFTIGEHTVDLGKKWERYDYRDIVEKHTGVDVLHITLEEVIQKLNELKVDYKKEGFNLERGLDSLWKYCRRQITGPGFLVGTPKILSPLAKTDPNNHDLTERFQPIIGGTELGNGYSELNDPIDQRARFDTQQKLRDEGDEEAQMADYNFVESLEYGMPPTCGFGMSERVFAVLAGKHVREAQIFPLLKPK